MKKIIYKSGELVLRRVMSGNTPLLLSKQNQHILIDTGLTRSWKTVSKNIDNLIKEDSLATLIITHAHHDHVENAALIKQKYDVNIIVHAKESQYLKDGITSPLTVYNNSNIDKHLYEPVTGDIIVEDELELINLGFNAKVIKTSGHSPGSISIIVNNSIVIVGDALGGMENKNFAQSIKVVSEETQLSWEKLINLNAKLYLPSHGGEEISYEALVEKYKSYTIYKRN